MKKEHEKKEYEKEYKKGSHVVENDGEEGDEPTGKDEPLKRGGEVKKKAHKAHGEKAKHRLDKRAHGGRVITPKSPLSGAAPTKMREGFSNKLHIGKESN